MQTITELRQSILDRADTDEAFRTRLLAEPKAALADEFDIHLADGFDLSIHEDSMSGAHLVLPPNPRMTEEQMAQVAGGVDADIPRPY